MEYTIRSNVVESCNESFVGGDNMSESSDAKSEFSKILNDIDDSSCNMKNDSVQSNSYKKKVKDKDTLKYDEKRLSNSVSNDQYANYDRKGLQEKTSSSFEKQYFRKTSSSRSNKTMPDELTSEMSALQTTSSKKLNSTTRKKLKNTTSSKTTNIEQPKDNFEHSEPVLSGGARSKLSAYFQSFMPRQIVESSEPSTKDPSVSDTKSKKQDLRVVDLPRKNIKKVNVSEEDSKIALRKKYIKWLREEKKFFYLNLNEEGTTLSPFFRTDILHLSDINESKQTYGSKKKKHGDQRKEDKKIQKENRNLKKCPNISQKNKLKDKKIYFKGYEPKPEKKSSSKNVCARMFTSAENARLVKSNSNIKKTMSLDGMHMTESNPSNAKLDFQENDNTNRNKLLNGNPNIIFVTSTEKKINISFNNCTLDYSGCEGDYFNGLNRNLFQNKKGSSESVNDLNKDKLHKSKPETITLQTGDNPQNVHSEKLVSYDERSSHSQDFERYFTNEEHFADENLYASTMPRYVNQKTRNIYFTNKDNYYYKQEKKQMKEAGTDNIHHSEYYLDSEKNVNNNLQFNCNSKSSQNTDSQRCTPEEISEESIHMNGSPIRCMNQFQNDDFIPINIRSLPNENSKQTADPNCVREENLMKQTQYYQFQNMQSNKLNGNRNYLKSVTNNSGDGFHFKLPECNPKVGASNLKNAISFDSKVKPPPYMDEHKFCFYKNLVYENLNVYKPHSTLQCNSDYSVIPRKLSRSDNQHKQLNSDVYGSAINCGCKNTASIKQFNVTSIQCDNGLSNESNIAIKIGRKRKLNTAGDNDIDDDKYDETLLNSKTINVASSSKTEQNKNEILRVMLDLHNKVTLLQNQISSMNTSCNKFGNLETLLLMLTSDVSNGLKKVENKLNITNDATCIYNYDNTISKAANRINKTKFKGDTDNIDQYSASNEIFNCKFIQDDSCTNETSTLEHHGNAKSILQCKKYKEIGLMTEEVQPSVPCKRCDDIVTHKICIYDKGVQCRMNETQNKMGEQGQSSLLAVEESNVVFIENLIKSNKNEDKTSPNTSTRANKKVPKKIHRIKITKVNTHTKRKTCIIL